jgi:glycosyltransferase involved in cell wall biosynthesis
MLAEITPLILTCNEAPNIERTLEPLKWAKEILLVDSFSTDQTLEIVHRYPQVRVVQRRFDSHAAQWNFGLQQCQTPWVLALDADYVLSEELLGELRSFASPGNSLAYFAAFKYCINGQPLRGSLYPPVPVLFQKDSCHYEQDGHTQRLRFAGAAGRLHGVIFHDDRKPLLHWLAAQERYAQLEAAKLLAMDPATMRLRDRLRLRLLSPAVVFLYTLFYKRLIFDGPAGWLYVYQRTLAEILLSLRLLESRLSNRTGH